MSILKVALLQMKSFGVNQEKNQAKGEQFCRKAKKLGADIALFPEMWNIGYSFPRGTGHKAYTTWANKAITRQDEYIKHFKSLAKELNMSIAITYLEKWNGSPRNSVSLIDRTGKILMTYAKVHTCDFSREKYLTPGNEFYVSNLDTAKGKITIGLMICYDREFPESARILMLKGAEIILVPNACLLDINRIHQLQTRAFENMLGVATANYASPQDDGHSAAFDGIAYEKGKSRNTCLVQAGKKEGIYMAEFDLTKLRNWREKEIWGNAYRKPNRYKLLLNHTTLPPFTRNNARKSK